MLKRLKRISGRLRSENPYWRYNIDEYELPGGSIGEYHWVETPGSVFVIPVTDDGRFVMTRQFRYLNQRESLEFPGGGVDPSLGYEKSAIRELRQESGFDCDSLEIIGEFNPFNGVTSEICRVYLASGLTGVEVTADESEEFEIMELSNQEIFDKINKGELWDGMTLAAWALYTAKLPQD